MPDLKDPKEFTVNGRTFYYMHGVSKTSDIGPALGETEIFDADLDHLFMFRQTLKESEIGEAIRFGFQEFDKGYNAGARATKHDIQRVMGTVFGGLFDQIADAINAGR